MAEAVCVPAHLVSSGSPWPKQLHHLHAQPSLGQSFHRLCIYAHGVTLVVSTSLRPRGLWPARFLCQWGSPGKNTGVYWPILVPHSLLEYYTSCCPSCQLPWVSGAARTPVTQAAAPPPYLALTGADPSPPGQPQEQIPVDDPHAEVEIKPQLKPRGSVAKEDPKPSHQLYKLQIKSTQSTRQILCLRNI